MENISALREEIEKRNRLRLEMGMPLLDVDAELARIAKVERDRAFRQYVDEHRDEYHRLWDQCAQAYSAEAYRGGWLNTFSKMAIEAMVLEIMRVRWRDSAGAT
jgi:hypothetical protein